MNKYVLVITIVIFFKAEAQSSALELADSLYVNGNYSKAIEAYKDYTNKAEVYDNIAKAYIALGNYDAALINYEKSIDVNPDNALLKLEYGKLLARIKKYKEASDVFKTLITIDSLNPNYHYELGLSLEKLQDSTAQVRFQNAFDLDNTHQKAIFRVARYHLIKRRFDSVNYYVDIGLKSYANNKELISLKAQNYYWGQYYHKAIEWFEKLISLNEKTEFIYEKLYASCMQVYDYDKAVTYATEALLLDPKNADKMLNLGKAYEQLGLLYKRDEDYKKAEIYVAQALTLLDQSLHKEYATLAGIYSIQKNYKEAIEAYKIAIKENPKDDFIHFRLVLVKDAYYKDIDARIKVYEDFIVAFPDSRIKDFAQRNLTKLKEEKFLTASEKKD